MIKAGLVVEGGGMRGVYSSGVLDFFIEKDLFLKITTVYQQELVTFVVIWQNNIKEHFVLM